MIRRCLGFLGIAWMGGPHLVEDWPLAVWDGGRWRLWNCPRLVRSAVLVGDMLIVRPGRNQNALVAYSLAGAD